MASTRTIFQLPEQRGPSWFENIAIRQNGTILATRMDKAELWSVDPATGAGTVILSIPGCGSLSGICALGGDVFALGVGDFSMGGGDKPFGPVAGTWGLWTADLTGGAEPVVSEVVKMPDVGMINGIAAWDDKTVLVTDTMGGKVYTVDLPSKKFSLAIADELMGAPAGSPIPFAINGIKVHRTPSQSYLYWTNTARQAAYRIPVAGGGSSPCTPSGAVETVAAGFSCDDLVLAADGTVYVCTNMDNRVLRIAGVSAEAVTLAGDLGSLELGGSTACVFSADESVLYVTTAGANVVPVDGKTEPAKVVEIKMPSW